MRHVNQEGLNLIKSFEGFRGQVYLCQAGVPTIGCGHALLKGESFPNGVSREEAETILQKDLEKAERAVLRLTKVPLSNGEFDALVSFTFNLGSGAYQRSTLRMKVNRGEDASSEFGKWIRAGGKISKGLVRRREAEKKLYLS